LSVGPPGAFGFLMAYYFFGKNWIWIFPPFSKASLRFSSWNMVCRSIHCFGRNCSKWSQINLHFCLFVWNEQCGRKFTSYCGSNRRCLWLKTCSIPNLARICGSKYVKSLYMYSVSHQYLNKFLMVSGTTSALVGTKYISNWSLKPCNLCLVSRIKIWKLFVFFFFKVAKNFFWILIKNNLNKFFFGNLLKNNIFLILNSKFQIKVLNFFF
jgi:hypothetical protein